jgi:MFS family permease
MSFQRFIYYCAVCGGWAAFLAWALVLAGNVSAVERPVLRTTLIAALLGLLLGAAVGAVDALQNAVGQQRFVRVSLCAAVGLVGGAVSGLIGEALHNNLASFRVLSEITLVLGWILVGVAIGASVGAFDLLRAVLRNNDRRAPTRKVVNGVIGGFLGGLVGGVLFEVLPALAARVLRSELPRSSLAIGLVVLGACIGLLIGLAQVILKEAWLKVEAGFRPGRELLLSKDETTIGRAESCDVGLFGDSGVERLHARILLRDARYLLADAGTPGGTFLNDVRVDGPTPLHDGDTIRVGHSALRFGERAKKDNKGP